SVKNISKSYAQKIILQKLSFSVRKGTTLGILGESGSGKTTLLRIIAGLLEPDAGTIKLGKEVIKPPSGTLVAGHEKIKLVQQDFQLFPNISVRENISYPIRKYEKDFISQRTEILLQLCSLEKVQDQLPKEISGGEKQRTAIAQVLADEPEVLLLDEPFNQLDIFRKKVLKSEIQKIVKKLKITCLLVSHDVADLTELATEMMILQDGKIIQSGTTQSIFDNPVNDYVAVFIGKNSF
ncbi:MAG: ABC transporter ATP-binding protein, partial [Verrucomicrobia bacterium]|nr:ABC transporter ATP-binding protein [Cytophagales bacterium]